MLLIRLSDTLVYALRTLRASREYQSRWWAANKSRTSLCKKWNWASRSSEAFDCRSNKSPHAFAISPSAANSLQTPILLSLHHSWNLFPCRWYDGISQTSLDYHLQSHIVPTPLFALLCHVQGISGNKATSTRTPGLFTENEHIWWQAPRGHPDIRTLKLQT